MNIVYRNQAADRRLGILLTALLHVALILAWQVARTRPPRPADGEPVTIQWIRLPAPALAPHRTTPVPAPAQAPVVPAHPRALPGVPPQPASAAAAPAANTAAPTTPAAAATSAAAPTGAPSQATVPATSTEQILQQAKRDIGNIDKALRKENGSPYIAAPLDSPQIRLRRGIEHAAEMAPPKLWEAPKSQELVNNTGDGARRTRVITGNGTYCITERAARTDVEMIEHHGKIRLTNCPQHEEPAKQQEWRSLQD